MGRILMRAVDHGVDFFYRFPSSPPSAQTIRLVTATFCAYVWEYDVSCAAELKGYD